jgi:hypothetical protein
LTCRIAPPVVMHGFKVSQALDFLCILASQAGQ